MLTNIEDTCRKKAILDGNDEVLTSRCFPFAVSEKQITLPAECLHTAATSPEPSSCN